MPDTAHSAAAKPQGSRYGRPCSGAPGRQSEAAGPSRPPGAQGRESRPPAAGPSTAPTPQPVLMSEKAYGVLLSSHTSEMSAFRVPSEPFSAPPRRREMQAVRYDRVRPSTSTLSPAATLPMSSTGRRPFLSEYLPQCSDVTAPARLAKLASPPVRCATSFSEAPTNQADTMKTRTVKGSVMYTAFESCDTATTAAARRGSGVSASGCSGGVAGDCMHKAQAMRERRTKRHYNDCVVKSSAVQQSSPPAGC